MLCPHACLHTHEWTLSEPGGQAECVWGGGVVEDGYLKAVMEESRKGFQFLQRGAVWILESRRSTQANCTEPKSAAGRGDSGFTIQDQEQTRPDLWVFPSPLPRSSVHTGDVLFLRPMNSHFFGTSLLAEELNSTNSWFRSNVPRRRTILPYPALVKHHVANKNGLWLSGTVREKNS